MVVQDVTPILDREDGSAFDLHTVLFSDYGNGAVFSYDASSAADMDEMLKRDGKARTLEQVLTLPIRQAPVSFRQNKAPSEVVDLIERTLTAPANNGGMTTPLNLVIAQMAGAIVYKKAYFEKVFTERDGRVVYDKLAWRPPSTCTIIRDPKNGAFRGFHQMPVRLSDTEMIKIPPQRAFVYLHGVHRNPMEGTSDMDVAFWCYQTKQKIRFLWYQFLEGQSLPKTIVKARDETMAIKAAKKVITLRSGGVVGLSSDIDVDTLESSGKGADQFKAAMQWLDAESSGSVLAGFTDLGAAAAGGTGSFALSKDLTDFFLMSRQAVSREMADAVNNYVIPDLVLYNFGPGVESPTMEFGPIAEDDATLAIQLLQATAQSTSPQIPREFMDELIERVAGFLELNTEKVRDGLERAAKEAAAKAAQVSANPAAPQVAAAAGAVNAATQAVIQKQQQMGAAGDAANAATAAGPAGPVGN